MTGNSVRVLVVAKAPVPGVVKTRVGAEVGMDVAAGLAAAALLDTVRTCTTAVGVDRCRLALAGRLTDATDGERLTTALADWSSFPQRGTGWTSASRTRSSSSPRRTTAPSCRSGWTPRR